MIYRIVVVFFLRSMNVYLNTPFFIRKTFTSTVRLKLAINQANAKQDPEAEFWLF